MQIDAFLVITEIDCPVQEIKNKGAIYYHGKDYLWIYITTDGWKNTAHSVACRELGFFFPTSGFFSHKW